VKIFAWEIDSHCPRGYFNPNLILFFVVKPSTF
jgi:hypothetical protein